MVVVAESSQDGEPAAFMHLSPTCRQALVQSPNHLNLLPFSGTPSGSKPGGSTFNTAECLSFAFGTLAAKVSFEAATLRRELSRRWLRAPRAHFTRIQVRTRPRTCPRTANFFD